MSLVIYVYFPFRIKYTSSMISGLSVNTIERGGLIINGMMIAAYYKLFVFMMAFFLLMSGILLTALAYRPQEMGEEWWEWTERFYKSQTSRVAGPLLIVISLLLHLLALSYCLLKRKAKYKESIKDKEETSDVKSRKSFNSEIGSLQVERKSLIVPTSDIACFPDGSLRLERS